MRAEVPIIYATQSGGTTIDQDAFGGNPFATALIEVAEDPGLRGLQLLEALRRQTMARSANHQTPMWSRLPKRRRWSLALPEGAMSDRRLSLVLIVSEYSALNPSRLAGAAIDERRIAAMLAKNGFSVYQGVAPDRASLLGALRNFAARVSSYDSAVIYSTGHGVEFDGNVYLLPGDYPFEQGYDAALLRKYALPVERIAQACRAATFNLAFFAGCRTKVRRKDVP